MISAQNPGDRVNAYLQMMRPANIVTAWADILAGGAVAGLITTAMTKADWATTMATLLWLLLATTGLYGGGVVFNDVFDAQLDALERPERPIPSGRSSVAEAIALGVGLLLLGIAAAAQVSGWSAVIASAIGLAALLYDAVSKHHPLLGSLNMGVCRGGNLLLGVSAIPPLVLERGFIAIIPILYIAAITLISRGEVNGGNRSTGYISLGLLALVASGLIGLNIWPMLGGPLLGAQRDAMQLLMGLPFIGFWGGSVFPAFIKAARDPTAELVRSAVRSGIIALIILDSAIAVSFSHWLYGLAILGLLPISRLLAKQFAVT